MTLKRNLYRLLAAVTLLVSAGCASTTQGVKEDFAFEPGGQTGLVVLSTRITDACSSGMVPVNLNYARDTNDEHGILLLKNFLIKNDFHDPDGFFYIRALPAGRYSFYKIEMPGTILHGGHIAEPLRFEVKAGVTHYLGEVTVNVPRCTEKGVLPEPTVTVRDERDRDRKLFDARMKSLSSKDFQYAILGK